MAPALLALGSAFLTVGYLCAVAAMRVGEIAAVSPFRYTSLLMAIFLGLVIFGDWPDLWTWVGSALVVGRASIPSGARLNWDGGADAGADAGTVPLFLSGTARLSGRT
ncbi:EamA family transporter [Paracoccus marcusii]|uniref:EamA family transporter n=1 Tax=Paracoccus marcusii TaxID=59779 RepID=UPI002ED53D1F|nr:EamA family transporter [Paracoccus marcusii]